MKYALTLLTILFACSAPLTQAQLLITEFMASNHKTLPDNDAEFNDWIEIHNTGSTSVDLSRWTLTDEADEPAKWTFPRAVLPAGAYMVVFASGKDRAVAGAPLHTGFSLNVSGEYLALIRPDGTIEATFSPEYPRQVADVSYGLSFVNGLPTATPGYFATPTPGQPNGSALPAISPDPQFSIPGGTYTNATFTVALSAPDKGVIRYTTNGAAPTATSPAYTSPLRVSDSRLIRARTFSHGKAPSPTVSETYILIGADLVNFSSNLPLAIINTFGKSLVESAHIPITATFIDNNRGRTTLFDKPNYQGHAQAAIRGSSSAGFPKKSYKFEIQDEQGSDLKADLLGMPADSDWVLYAPYTDKTLMRDVLAYEFSNRIGRYAPRTKFFELYVDRGSKVTKADYVGVYVLIEKVKRGANRVPIDELLPSMKTMPEISGGYLLKKDRLDSGDVGFNTTRHTLAYVDPKEKEAAPEQRAWIRSWMAAYEASLYGTNFKHPQLGYRAHIDVPSFIDHFWLVELCKNIDGFRLSTFMHKPREGKLHMGPIWDYNLSLGNADYLDGWRTNGWYNSSLGDGDYPWYRRLFQDPDFRQAHIDAWDQYRKTKWTRTWIHQRVDEMALYLDEAQKRNYDRWRILGTDVWPNWYVGKTYEQEIEWMKGWITGRLTWINNQFVPAPTFGIVHTEQGLALTINSRQGTIFYSTDGTDPRVTGGSPALTANAYTSPILLSPNMRIVARARNGTSWSAPTDRTINGIDLWREIHFADPANPAISGDLADPDSDGQPNWAEFAAGTSPSDGDDLLQLSGAHDGAQFIYEFQAAPGKSYSLERAASVTSTSWELLEHFPATPVAQSWSGKFPAVTARGYFRLVVHP